MKNYADSLTIEEAEAANLSDLCLSLDQWDALQVPLREYLLGHVFTRTTRAMFSAATGLGKTNIAMALVFAVAAGEDFCHWAGSGEPRNVLFVDGEMPQELMQERLRDAERRLGNRPRTLSTLCRDQAESKGVRIPPLDTEDGRKWMDDFIASIPGELEFIVLDNIASLTTGDLKDEESWKAIAPWVRQLTAQRIGVLWIHHAGHDASRGYGTKTREWDLETVIVGEKVEDNEADIAAKLTFTKARTRKPDNRDDFEPVTLRLVDDVWETTAAPAGKSRKLPKGAVVALNTLREAIDAVGETPPPVGPIPTTARGVPVKVWRDYFHRRTPLDVDRDADAAAEKRAKDARRQAFTRGRSSLQESGHVECVNDWCWIIR